MLTRPVFRFFTCALPTVMVLLAFPLGKMAQAQDVTRQQMQALLPDEQDLQGFTRVRPAGEVPLTATYSQDSGKWVQPVSPATRLEDGVDLNKDLARVHPGQMGIVSHLSRRLYSVDGIYTISMLVKLYDSTDNAHKEVNDFRQGSQSILMPGTFSSHDSIGDESWFNPNGYSTLIYRYGKMVVLIDGSRSWTAGKQGSQPAFSPQVVETVAQTILLRASRQANLIRVPRREVRLTVNGRALSGIAAVPGGQLYVPVANFAKAAGLQNQWKAKTGALMLTSPTHQPISVTAGSTAARVGIKDVALLTPVLKEGGQPVMTLHDLLTLVGGRVAQKGDTLQVTV
ncbi:MAG: hypothetical protein JO250_06025 [Armatimonadetes bacterium]|nr:hypothetical protein [Armatimonadota bacterium]